MRSIFLVSLMLCMLIMSAYAQSPLSVPANAMTETANGQSYRISSLGVEPATMVQTSPRSETDVVTGHLFGQETILWTNIKDVRIVDGIAYGVMPNGLIVVDVTNPSQSTLMSKMPFVAEGMALDVHNHVAYVGRAGDVLKIDVIDPYQPVILDTLLSDVDTVFAIVVTDSFMFAACGPDGVRVVDPHYLVGSYPMANAVALSVDSITATMVVADYDCGLTVLDISIPLQPVHMGDYALPGHTMDAVMSDGVIYSISTHNGLDIFNLSDSCQPYLVGTYPMQITPNDVWVGDSSVVLIAGYDGVTVLDATNPSLPTVINHFHTPAFSRTVSMHDDNIYVCDDWAGLRIHTIDSTFIGCYATPGHSNDLCMWRNYLLVADFGNGVRVVDRSTFQPISLCQLGWGTWDIVADTYGSEYAYAVAGHQGLIVIDLADPYQPVIVGQLNTPGNVYGAFIQGDYAYVADLWAGWYVVDIADRTNPHIIATRSAATFVTSVWAEGNTLYVLDQNTGLSTWDVSDPYNPQQIGFHATSGFALTLTVRGDYAYVACGAGGVQIFDVSIPAAPVLIATVPTCYAIDVALSSRYLYVADQLYVTVVDVIDPRNPFIPLQQPVINISTGIVAKEFELYGTSDVNTWACWFDPTGINDLRNLPVQFSLDQNYPNPFNAATTIRYAIPTAGPVKVEIYDILGRLVGTPIDENQTAGEHRFVWDGTRHASGVYLYRFTSGQTELVSRMTLLK